MTIIYEQIVCVIIRVTNG